MLTLQSTMPNRSDFKISFRYNRPLLIRFIALALLIAVMPFTASAAIRDPVYAGRFYPADGEELARTIDRLTQSAAATKPSTPDQGALKALILPHAGYIYSGLTAAHAAGVLEGRRYKRVVLIGPDHYVGFNGAAISGTDAYQTPLGLVKLDPVCHKLRQASALFSLQPLSDQKEHSLEVVLPFLQRYLDPFMLVPVVVGTVDIDQIAAKLAPLLKGETLLVVSSDLSHYLPYAAAAERDRETIRLIETLDGQQLIGRDNCACGKAPILIAMKLAQQYQWRPTLLSYTNSGDTAGDKRRVVGYAAIAFWEGPHHMSRSKETTNTFTPEQGRVLIRLARQTLQQRLGQPIADRDRALLEEALSDPAFQHHYGTFVTLKKRGRLRGCIGSLTAAESIKEDVRNNAQNAAFRDPRFGPLTQSELDQVEIEVSILTPPTRLEYADGPDLLTRLRPGIDGVIIRKGAASATFLPQVWEQLSNKTDFLAHLCQKAGLSRNAWQSGKLEVKTYQVQYFEESQ